MNTVPNQVRREASFLSRWLLSWRILFSIPLLFACAVILFYAVEDWRGWHAWNQYRRTLKAQGERLDLRALIPANIPDQENFAANPFVRSWFDRPESRAWDDDYKRVAASVNSPGADLLARRHLLDLGAWAEAFDPNWTPKTTNETDSGAARAEAAAVVLRGLKASEAALAELQAASSRPAARYPIVYDLDHPWGILLPHLAKAKAGCQRLQLRACAELAAGQSNRALDDIRLGLYLADSVAAEPFLISHLVRIASLQLTIQPIWEGLTEHRFSESELQSLQGRLEKFDFVESTKTALQVEQAGGIWTIDTLRRCGLAELMPILNLGQDTTSPAFGMLFRALGLVIPRGWYYQEELNYSRLWHLTSGGCDPMQGFISPQLVSANARVLNREVHRSGGPTWAVESILHHRFLASLLLPALSRTWVRGAAAQTAVNQAVIGCALERFRLAHGSYPDSLEALCPTYLVRLPRDVTTGQSYQFRHEKPDRYSLYSVGWDGTDDNGEPGRTMFDESWGDWVW